MSTDGKKNKALTTTTAATTTALLSAPRIIGGECALLGIGAPLPGQPPAFICHCANGSTLVGSNRCTALPHLLATHSDGACVVNQNHTVSCWGSHLNGDSFISTYLQATIVPNLTNVIELSYDCNDDGLCAILLDRTAKCWGFGLLGDSVNLPTPSDAHLSNVQQIAFGQSHGCALLLDGSLVCWGDNNYFQRGDELAGPKNSSFPTHVNLPGAAHKVSTAAYHSCALLEDTSIYCWGQGFNGQLGDGKKQASSIPVRALISSVGAKDVATTDGATCAVLLDDTVQCWGYNGQLELGVGDPASTTFGSGVPLTLSLTGVKSISGRRNAYCVVLLNTGVKCWGSNYNGAIGEGGDSIYSPLDLPVTNVDQIHVNTYNTCAKLINQTVLCWGKNYLGQLGDGTTSDHYDPRPVLGV